MKKADCVVWIMVIFVKDWSTFTWKKTLKTLPSYNSNDHNNRAHYFSQTGGYQGCVGF